MYMFWIKRNFILIGCLALTHLVWAQKTGTYRIEKNSFGPSVGYGLNWGNRVDFKNTRYHLIPGATAGFGMHYFRVVSDYQSLGVGLNYLPTRWNFDTNDTLGHDRVASKYSVFEKSITSFFGFNHMLSGDQTRPFIGIGLSPGWTISKNIQRMKDWAGDTTTAVIIPETHNFRRLTFGLTVQLGLDGDFDVGSTWRMYFEFNTRFYGGNKPQKGYTNSFHLVAQYFFNE